MRFKSLFAASILLVWVTATSGCTGGSALGSRATGAITGAAGRNASGQPAATPPGAAPASPTAPLATSPVAPPIPPPGSHALTFVNHCAQTIWVGALTNETRFALPEHGGWQLNQNDSHSIILAGTWGGRFWARTRCVTTDGVFKCETGDCGGVTCDGRGGAPASLAEFYLSDAAGKDTYDVSLVDAFNLPISIAPSPNALPASGVSGKTCGAPTCAADINASCPEALRQKNQTGDVIACYSACQQYNTPQTCCTDNFNTPSTCPATPLSTSFKNACPDAYSYAYDDTTSTYTCTANAYTITFCPSP